MEFKLVERIRLWLGWCPNALRKKLAEDAKPVIIETINSPPSISVTSFLEPERIKIILFVIFLLIATAGSIQSYAFTNGEQFGMSKPMFYDILRPVPFWPMWMYLLLPLFLVSAPLSLLGLNLSRSPIFFPVNIIYFYVLASFMVFSYERYRPKFTKKFWTVLIGLALGINLLNLTVGIIAKFVSIKMSGGLVGGFLMGIVNWTFVIILYGYLFTCIALLTSDGFRRLR